MRTQADEGEDPAMLLKKIVSYLLLPYPLVLVLLITGTLLLWFTSRQRAGKALVAVGVFVLLILSWPVTGNLLLAPLHRSRPLVISAETVGVRWVVVLGGGYSTQAQTPANARLSSPSLVRLIEGIRLTRGLPGSRLLLSGGPVYGGVPEAEVMAEAAALLGIPRTEMVLESKSVDTQDQARLVRDIVGDDRFVLVTSALHMRRSLRLFEKQGMKPIPAPAGFWSDQTALLPSSQSIVIADAVDHEYIGMLWSILRGTM